MRDGHFVPETKRVADLLRSSSATASSRPWSSTSTAAPRDWSRSRICWRNWWGRSATKTTWRPSRSSSQPDGSLVVNAAVSVDELAERLEIDIEHEGFETVAGLLLAHSGRVPAAGEHVGIGDLAFDIVEADRQRVLKVRVRRLFETPSA